MLLYCYTIFYMKTIRNKECSLQKFWQMANTFMLLVELISCQVSNRPIILMLYEMILIVRYEGHFAK